MSCHDYFAFTSSSYLTCGELVNLRSFIVCVLLSSCDLLLEHLSQSSTLIYWPSFAPPKRNNIDDTFTSRATIFLYRVLGYKQGWDGGRIERLPTSCAWDWISFAALLHLLYAYALLQVVQPQQFLCQSSCFMRSCSSAWLLPRSVIIARNWCIYDSIL